MFSIQYQFSYVIKKYDLYVGCLSEYLGRYKI